jgi:hypothetical protein
VEKSIKDSWKEQSQKGKYSNCETKENKGQGFIERKTSKFGAHKGFAHAYQAVRNIAR